MIRTLPRVVPAAPGKPERPEARSTQLTSLAIAQDPGTWDAGMARETVRRCSELAPVWNDERGGYRPLPLADALERGVPPASPGSGGWCVEVGCGTGLLTPLLARRWARVLCLDLTWDMLHRSPAPGRVLADASRLPLPGGVASAVVLADVPLFAAEVVRVLAPDGVVVWSNALGTGAPHHVPVPVVLEALQAASGVPWSGVSAEAGWGLWGVLRPDATA